MDTKEFWARLRAGVIRSWTMWSVYILAVLGVAESQFHLLRPYLGEKVWGIAYFGVLLIVSIARLKGLMAQAKVR